jgi:hypothetical protein
VCWTGSFSEHDRSAAVGCADAQHRAEELRQLVHRLSERGFVVDSVAQTLNLKPARVKRVLSEPVSDVLAEAA